MVALDINCIGMNSIYFVLHILWPLLAISQTWVQALVTFLLYSCSVSSFSKLSVTPTVHPLILHKWIFSDAELIMPFLRPLGLPIFFQKQIQTHYYTKEIWWVDIQHSFQVCAFLNWRGWKTETTLPRLSVVGLLKSNKFYQILHDHMSKETEEPTLCYFSHCYRQAWSWRYWAFLQRSSRIEPHRVAIKILARAVFISRIYSKGNNPKFTHIIVGKI